MNEQEMASAPIAGAAPFRWDGYPGVPLLGARRSIGGMIGALVACLGMLILFVGIGQFATAGTDLSPTLAALVQLVAYGLAYGSWLLVVNAGRKRAGVSYPEWVALRPFSKWPGLLAALVAFSLALWVYLAFAAAVVAVGIQPPVQPTVVDIFPVTPLGIAIAFLSVCIIGPLGEEVLFRGVLFAGLRDRIGQPWAMVVSALVFSAAHASWFVLLPFFVFGVLLARITAQSRSVWPAFIAHALFNLTSLAFTYTAHFLGTPVSAWTGSMAEAIAVLLR